jgi:predicted small integral membrane protein
MKTKASCQAVFKPTSQKTNTYTSTFIRKKWQDDFSFYGSAVWTDGENIYLAGTHILNKETGIWEEKVWNNLPNNFTVSYIWTDGTDIYYSSDFVDQRVLNKETSTWEPKTWSSEPDNLFYGSNIWTDGIYFYSESSQGCYGVLVDGVWKDKSWGTNPSFISASNVWTDGTNIYCSMYNAHYVLVGDTWQTKAWEPKTWNGLSSFSGNDIWTDGTDIYYSDDRIQYVLNKETDTWKKKTWNGLSSFDASSIWTDGENIYYSSNTAQYQLLPSTAKLYSKVDGAWVSMGSIS